MAEETTPLIGRTTGTQAWRWWFPSQRSRLLFAAFLISLSFCYTQTP